MTLLGAAAIGLLIGFLGGLLGKGGSAIATPMLHAIGVPAIVAVASPLPATIPSMLLAGYAYAEQRLVDWRLARWCIGFGVPATAIGALLTRWIDGGFLVKVTDVVLVGLGTRLLLGARRAAHAQAQQPVTAVPDGTVTSSEAPGAMTAVAPPPVDGTIGEPSALRLISVAVTVGLVSGLLANSGGFLLAPLFITVLRLPIRAALANSLAVASGLAVPGTIVHVALGHVDWTLVAVFAATSVPLSYLGARVALRIDASRLETLYGAALVVLGGVFLLLR